MDPAGFEELCEATYDKVAGAAYLILGDREGALDVAQETFTRAFERWGQVGAMENPGGWVYRVAVNLSLSTRRRARRRSPRADFQVGAPPEPPDVRLLEALRSLTPAQRSAVVARYYLDLSIAQTAELLGKREGTVRALTSQATARLRGDLGPGWFEDDEDEPAQRSTD
jgi:RNA polymerase sigma-70 factor (ECF subfamily)